MPVLDRSFVVSEPFVRQATRAAFVAWHHLPRPWRRYAGYALAGGAVTGATSNAIGLLLVPVVLAADVVTRYRATAHDSRTQEPVGTTIAIGFGDDAFAFQTWTQARAVPYAAVRKVVRSGGCVVIVALSERIFWPLPAELVPEDAIARMTRPAGRRSSPR